MNAALTPLFLAVAVASLGAGAMMFVQWRLWRENRALTVWALSWIISGAAAATHGFQDEFSWIPRGAVGAFVIWQWAAVWVGLRVFRGGLRHRLAALVIAAAAGGIPNLPWTTSSGVMLMITTPVVVVVIMAGIIGEALSANARLRLTSLTLWTALMPFWIGVTLIRPVVCVITPDLCLAYPLWLTYATNLTLLILVVASAVGQSTMVAESARRVLTDAASTDSLTRLLNRSGLANELRRLADDDRAVANHSILMIDIDHFKSVNDGFGHLAGDSLITTFADLARKIVGPPHLVSRFGGDEFCIVLVGTDRSVASQIADALRHEFALHRVDTIGGAVRTTLSIGIAETDCGGDFAAALSSADVALYQAKSLGRNQVRIA